MNFIIYLRQPACKPSSVSWNSPGGDHLSRPAVTDGLKRPTRGLAGCPEPPYLVLLQMGLARPACCHAAGALLPHHFTLTQQSWAECFCCAFRGVAPPGSYPASSPGGARTFLSVCAAERPPSRLAGSSIARDRLGHRCGAVALLVLPAAAAGTGIVAADLLSHPLHHGDVAGGRLRR